MNYENWFDRDENKTLLAICARKMIRGTGIAGIIWGLINIVLGVVAMHLSMLNVGVLVLGLLMLGAGIQALRRPTLGVLLAGTVVTALLFAWNLAITILNAQVTGTFVPQGLIFPLIIMVGFITSYRRLKHLEGLIAAVRPEDIRNTKKVCKTLLKKKLKNEPAVIQANGRACRAQLMIDKAFFINRMMLRAFVASKDEIRSVIVKPDAKRLEMNVRHPLGKLKYRFDKKNSEKLKNWLSAAAPPAEAQSQGS